MLGKSSLSKGWQSSEKGQRILITDKVLAKFYIIPCFPEPHGFQGCGSDFSANLEEGKLGELSQAGGFQHGLGSLVKLEDFSMAAIGLDVS